ncbi:MAG TPA: iron chelate uptake ABC transporter family permease subunit [Planctomycetaceae bacterium]|nr:iron chelate uptake ABC transporter family permease subunit [Planctomycetaceae bacterium]
MSPFESLSLLAVTEWARVFLLRDYNTRIVLCGTVLLGIAGGVIGALMLLRKRALVADVASHAALPGIGAAYLLMESYRPDSGRWVPGLLLGATISAALGLLFAQGMGRIRRIKEDAALAITLSLFFGVGIALLTWIQALPTGHAAGLSEFLFGKAAALLARDITSIAVAGGIAVGVVVLLRKEFCLLCFDSEYALASGWPVHGLDVLLTALVIMMTVVGMQSVGLLLIVALMVLPPTAARFWTDRFEPLLWLSGTIGGASAAGGVILSALVPKFAAGAVIVLSGSLLFALSFLFGTRRGVWWRYRGTAATQRQIALDDLLRACYEILEPYLHSPDALTEHPIAQSELLQKGRWSLARLQPLLRLAERSDLLRRDFQDRWRLTATGRRAAIQAARNHRLWELYLIHYADIPLVGADRSADAFEHSLRPEILEQLETMLETQSPRLTVPSNPHAPHDPKLSATATEVRP